MKNQESSKPSHKMKHSNYSTYKKFLFMMLLSFLIMYGIMFLNVFQLEHVMVSAMRTYMALLMVAPMAISMLLFMWGMYENRNLNYAIIGISIAVFCFSLYGVRTQAGISDIQWMKGMIPHHSSAILTSSNAHFSDPQVKKLADNIIQAQEKEIADMKAMIQRLQKTN